jgi:outer membrane lipoprotein-sorting protein
MKRHKRFLAALALVAGLVAAPAAARAAGEREGALLDRLQQLSAGSETLASDFTQEKYLAVFQDKMVSSGRFYFKKPDALRWELTRPVATGFVLQGDRGRISTACARSTASPWSPKTR